MSEILPFQKFETEMLHILSPVRIFAHNIGSLYPHQSKDFYLMGCLFKICLGVRSIKDIKLVQIYYHTPYIVRVAIVCLPQAT